LPLAAAADPIHAIADGAYWHHDSNWVFPARVAAFTRVGIPQDIAGSLDASAWYALQIDGARVVASVEIQAVDSAEGLVQASDQVPQRALIHSYQAGEWRVRIYLQAPQGAVIPPQLLEDFVRSQHWDRLSKS
jgi:hypothetical protein